MEPTAYQNLVNNENHSWAYFGWITDYPNPENFTQTSFQTGAGTKLTTPEQTPHTVVRAGAKS